MNLNNTINKLSLKIFYFKIVFIYQYYLLGAFVAIVTGNFIFFFSFSLNFIFLKLVLSYVYYVLIYKNCTKLFLKQFQQNILYLRFCILNIKISCVNSRGREIHAERNVKKNTD